MEEISIWEGRHPNENLVSPGLREGRYLSLQERFEEWLETPEGDYIYREVGRRAYRLRSRGWNHYGIKAIIESIRHDRDVAVGPNDGGFKVNNNYTSRMARKLMAEDTLLDGFFEVRELKAP